MDDRYEIIEMREYTYKIKDKLFDTALNLTVHDLETIKMVCDALNKTH